MAATNVFSGSRAIFQINDKAVAYAYGVDVDEEIMHEEVQVLDMLSVLEHVPVAYRVSLRAEIFRTIGADAPGVPSEAVGAQTAPVRGSLKSNDNNNIFPQMGISDIQALNKAVMTAKIIDALSNNTLATVTGVRAASKSFSVRARQIVGENVRFVAQRVRDESGG